MAVTWGIRTNAAAVAAKWKAAGPVATAKASTVATTTGQVCQTRARANASGRSGVYWSPGPGSPTSNLALGAPYPAQIGPRVETGDFRRGIYLLPLATPGSVGFVVGSNSPQAARLEFGFFGLTDSLGRTFHQYPLPWLRPAAEASRKDWLAGLAAVPRTLDLAA